MLRWASGAVVGLALALGACGGGRSGPSHPASASPPRDYAGAIVLRTGDAREPGGPPSMLLAVRAPPPGATDQVDAVADGQPARLLARLEQHESPCPPCPPGAACSQCPPPYARFSSAGRPGTFFVQPWVDISDQPLGATYVLEGSWRQDYQTGRIFDAVIIARLDATVAIADDPITGRVPVGAPSLRPSHSLRSLRAWEYFPGSQPKCRS